MFKAQRIWLFILSLFLGLQIYLFFFKKKAPLQKPVIENRLEGEAHQIQQRMQGGHLVESQGGKRDWELLSKVSISYQGRSDWDLEGVEIRFYNSELNDIVVKGDKGNIDMVTKNMRIEGHVEIRTTNGYIFYAPYIQYTAQSRLIFCDQTVKVLGPMQNKLRTLSLQSLGIQIPVNERRMILQKNVTGNQNLENGEALKIASQSAELSVLNQTAQFIGQVILDHSGRILKSSKASFFYNDKTKNFQSLEMKGSVELSQGDRRVLSEDLKMDFATQRLTFSGQPRLYQGEDELFGDKIIFLDGGKRVKVEKVKAKGISTP